jgi:hypothetical protein
MDTLSPVLDTTDAQFHWTSNPSGFYSSMAKPVVQPGVTTDYYLFVTDSLLCPFQDTVTVTVSPNQIPVYPTFDTTICSGQAVSIGQANSNGAWTWTSLPSGFSAAASNPSVTPTANTTYFASISNSLGCVRGDTVIVTTNPVPPTPTITLDSADELISSASSGNQWYLEEQTAIPGADSVFYKPQLNGVYSLRVTQDGCTSAFATEYAYVYTAVTTIPNDSITVSITPNPATSNVIYVHFHIPTVNQVQVEIVDLYGRNCLNRENVTDGASINLPSLARGLYAVRVTAPNKLVTKVFLVLLN